jgi:hypothetical protein
MKFTDMAEAQVVLDSLRAAPALCLWLWSVACYSMLEKYQLNIPTPE